MTVAHQQNRSRTLLRRSAAEKWRGIHGCQCMWNFDGRWHEKMAKLDEVLKRLNSKRLNTLLAEQV